MTTTEPYEPTLEEIAAEAQRIRNHGYIFEGKQRPPWRPQRFGVMRDYEFQVVKSPANGEWF